MPTEETFLTGALTQRKIRRCLEKPDNKHNKSLKKCNLCRVQSVWKNKTESGKIRPEQNTPGKKNLGISQGKRQGDCGFSIC